MRKIVNLKHGETVAKVQGKLKKHEMNSCIFN